LERIVKVLITGVTGMLGFDLVRVLKDKHQLYGVGRRKAKLSDVRYLSCDLKSPKVIESYLNKIRPDVVIHTAAMTQVDDCELEPNKAYAENVLATHCLIRACKRIKPFFVFISTDYVYEGNSKGAIKETQKVSPVNVYGSSKWLAEELLVNSSLNYAIVRTSWLYGVNGPNFIKAILNLSKSRKVLKVVDDQIGAPTNTFDLAKGIKRLIENKRKRSNSIYHISSSGKTNWKKFAEEILKIENKSTVKVLPIKTKDCDRPAVRPKNSLLSNGKFKSRYGYGLRSWNEGLKDYLAQ